MLLKMKGQNYCLWLKRGETKVCGSIAKYTWLGSAMAVKSLYLAGGVGRESKAISIFVGPVGGTGSYYGKKLWSGKLE